MSAKPSISAEAALAVAPLADSAARSTPALLLELAKARLSTLVLFTVATGYILGSGSGFDWARFALTLAGACLAAFGANALNQCIEAARDARMRRTRRRPLPACELSPAAAWSFACVTAFVGPALLLLVNSLTALLAGFTVLLYVLVYTPMKVRTPLNTLVGAVVGGIPPMMGWTAATNSLDPGAWTLGAILFVWQIPHFLALAWMYRDDYLRGGFRMLPAVDPTGEKTCQAMVVYALALIPITLMLSAIGITGWIYAGGAIVLGIFLLAACARMYRERTGTAARRAMLASVLYLPILLVLMVADRAPNAAQRSFPAVSATPVVDLAPAEQAAEPFESPIP